VVGNKTRESQDTEQLPNVMTKREGKS